MSISRLLTILSLGLLLALAGCGGDDDSGGGGDAGGGGAESDPSAAYAQAVEGLDTLRSGKLDARLDFVLRLGVEQTITVAERATFADGGGTTLPKFDLTINVEQSSGEPQETSAINTGDTVYIKAQGAADYQDRGSEAAEAMRSTYRREQEALDPGRIPLLSLTPSDWAKSPRVEGADNADGVAVRRIVADLDVPAFLRDLETGKESEIGMGVTLGQDARRLLEPGTEVQTASLVALVGEDDGRLRRLTANLDSKVGGGVKVDFDVQMGELDQPQQIAAP
jgi:hypothetical protein